MRFNTTITRNIQRNILLSSVTINYDFFCAVKPLIPSCCQLKNKIAIQRYNSHIQKVLRNLISLFKALYLSVIYLFTTLDVPTTKQTS